MIYLQLYFIQFDILVMVSHQIVSQEYLISLDIIPLEYFFVSRLQYLKTNLIQSDICEHIYVNTIQYDINIFHTYLRLLDRVSLPRISHPMR
jgi:hypothetical protein